MDQLEIKHQLMEEMFHVQSENLCDDSAKLVVGKFYHITVEPPHKNNRFFYGGAEEDAKNLLIQMVCAKYGEYQKINRK